MELLKSFVMAALVLRTLRQTDFYSEPGLKLPCVYDTTPRPIGRNPIFELFSLNPKGVRVQGLGEPINPSWESHPMSN